MENAAEALKIAFAVLLFVMALTLSMSSFSQATSAVKAITSLRDREIELQYANVEPTNNFNFSRTVGIETVVATMYRAYEENIEIYFFDEGGNPLRLYYDEDGITPVSSIDSEDENYEKPSDIIEHLDIILGGTTVLSSKHDKIQEKYNGRIWLEGFYIRYSDREFVEQFGEYIQGEDSSEIKKRVITYTLK